MYLYLIFYKIHILFYSNVSIAKLNSNHTGKYECKSNSSSGTQVQSISLTIISNKTKFCEIEGDVTLIIIDLYLFHSYNITIMELFCIILESKDNKGTYAWTRTVSDVITVKHCQANEEVEPLARGTVSRHCNRNGKWDLPDTSDCPYTSPITRIFYTQSKV